MPERTAVVEPIVRRARALGHSPVVGVAGFDSPWRDDLVARVQQLLPEAEVVVGGPDLREVEPRVGVLVWLQVTEADGRFLAAVRDWELNGRRARGEPLLRGATWSGVRPATDPVLAEDFLVERWSPRGTDVEFVPVSGVLPPRRLRLFWDQTDAVIWDEDYAFYGELEDLLPMSAELRSDIRQWAVTHDRAVGRGRFRDGSRLGREGRRLAARLEAELAPEFVVTG